jgi:hypothetical protein
VRGRTATNFDGVLPWREKCRNVSALWRKLANVLRRRKLRARCAVDQGPHGSTGRIGRGGRAQLTDQCLEDVNRGLCGVPHAILVLVLQKEERTAVERTRPEVRFQ